MRRRSLYELSAAYAAGEMKSRGGRREGAGRKRAPGARPSVEHRTRPEHREWRPSHVTVPFMRSVGNLRTQLIYNTLRRIFLRPKIEGFRVVHHSVQKHHVHLIIEAKNREVLSSGMRSLVIRAALALLLLAGRKKGKVIRDRYHRRDLTTAAQVRTAIVYVLLNGAKHKVIPVGTFDRFSSADFFDGWLEGQASSKRPIRRAGEEPGRHPPRAQTALLLTHWRKFGLISPWEAERWNRDAARGVSSVGHRNAARS